MLVRWQPDETKRKIDRIQSNNAQYQIFSELDDITLSNIKFEYIPADIFEHTDAWAGPGNWTKDQIRNAEFQFLNKGNVTLKNCTFEKVIASPFGDQQNRPGDANRSLTVTDCTFSNVYNAYALKDIYPANAVIKDNHFENCSGAIYFEGTIPRGTIAISENQFGNIDQYAAAGKENTRGIIQLSAGFTTATSTQIILKDNTITGNLVKDENVTGGLAVLRQIANLDGREIGGWTPGKAFSIKAEGAYTLPSMPGGTDGKINYRFAGWAATDDYLGATDITNESRFLAAGQETQNGMYYAVWEPTSCTVIYSDGAGGAVFADQVFTVVPGDATPRFNGTATHSQRNGNREYHIYCCVGGNKAHTDTHDLRRSYVDPYRLSRSHVEPHRCPRSSQNGGWKRAGDLDWPAAAWRRRHGGSCAAYEKEKKLRHKNTDPVP